MNKINSLLFFIKDFYEQQTLVFIVFIVLLFLSGFLCGRIKIIKNKSKLRKDAVKRSRAVIGGQMVEQLSPYLPNFPCNPADARFIGKPIDFIAFPGAVNNEKIKEVLLIEVKSGNSMLSEREKEIKKAVEEGRVRYVEYRI